MLNNRNHLNTNGTTIRQNYEAKFKRARSNLLIMLICTVVNILLMIFEADLYFLFSAFIPFIIVDFGMLLCGLYPSEYYTQGIEGLKIFPNQAFAVFLAIAAVFILLYLLSWIFSKNQKKGWLIFALTLFSIDTAFMLIFMDFQISTLIDMIFHGWVILSLARGIHAINKLKTLPEDEEVQPEISTDPENTTEDIAIQNDEAPEILQNSMPLRLVDPEVKARILLQAEVGGYNIVYRRVKRVNELVVNNVVYAEYEALVEFEHTLTATLDGHTIEACYDGKLFSIIKFDGEQVAKKIRTY